MRDADARCDRLRGDALGAMLAGELDHRLDGFFAARLGRVTLSGFGGRLFQNRRVVHDRN